MGPRPDGADHLVGLGRGEHELDVRRRLLDELQQGVEALRGDHVRLVDDVDLVAAGHRREERSLAQVASIVDAAVAGGVDLDHVDAAGTAAGQVAARQALPARLGPRAELAVQRAGEDAGRGRLAAAARTGEQVGVVDPVVGQGPLQRLGDVLLPDHVGEGVRPVAAVEGERCSLRGRHGGLGDEAGGPKLVGPSNSASSWLNSGRSGGASSAASTAAPRPDPSSVIGRLRPATPPRLTMTHPMPAHRQAEPGRRARSQFPRAQSQTAADRAISRMASDVSKLIVTPTTGSPPRPVPISYAVTMIAAPTALPIR